MCSTTWIQPSDRSGPYQRGKIRSHRVSWHERRRRRGRDAIGAIRTIIACLLRLRQAPRPLLLSRGRGLRFLSRPNDSWLNAAAQFGGGATGRCHLAERQRASRFQDRSNHIARRSLCVSHYVLLRLCRAAGRSLEYRPVINGYQSEGPQSESRFFS